MTGLERTRAAMRGHAVDRVPVFPILIAPACRLMGVKQRDYNLDPHVMAETLLEARELCGFDGIYVSRDNWIYHEALGGTLDFPEDDESFTRTPLLADLPGWRSISVPDPENAPGMRTVLEAARQVVAAAGDRFYVQANIDTGPFSLAAVLRGAEAFLVDLVTADEGELRGLLELCTDIVIAYGKAMIATGVHGIQFGDATASLVSPADFQRFVVPYQRRALEALAEAAGAAGAAGRAGAAAARAAARAAGAAEAAGAATPRGTAPGVGAEPACDLWIHICGRTDHVLPLMRGLPFQGFEVDAKVPLREARRLLGDAISLKGNLDTTFLLRQSAEQVRLESVRILREGPPSGVVFSPGCGVPRMTPLENLRAMVQAAEDHAGKMR